MVESDYLDEFNAGKKRAGLARSFSKV